MGQLPYSWEVLSAFIQGPAILGDTISRFIVLVAVVKGRGRDVF